MTNINPEQVNQARSILGNSKNILLAIPVDPSIDNVASALALYLSLSAAGKQVSIITPTEITVQFNHLIGVDKISTSFTAQNGKNLIISFPYTEGSIEKVSYNIENETFNLVIEPREGYPSVLPEMMKYNFSGGNYDTIVTIGAANIEELGQIYSNNQNLFNEKQVINIDDDIANSNFGKINLIDSKIASLSELVLGLIDQMNLPVEADIATNLLTGLTAQTNNFSSPKTTATTFETAAMLLKFGAQKTQITTPPDRSNFPQFMKQDKKQDQPNIQKNINQFGLNQNSPYLKPQPKPFISPGGFKSRFPTQPQQQAQPIRQPQPLNKNTQQNQPSTYESSKPPETPPDWLKPKIYKGSTLL